MLHCVGARTVLELIDGAVMNGVLQQISPLFHMDHISHHGSYAVGIVYCAVYLLCHL